MDFIWLALIPLPVVAGAVAFLRSWWRWSVSLGVTALPTLLFYAYLAFEWVRQGFSIDFTVRPNHGLAMGMIMVPAYNLVWIPPALAGLGAGLLFVWLRKRNMTAR